ncbi:MAG: hypothetical protein K8J08_10690 [Thermoanaerobaculia bacterium]|nr:hypothetical protein [Thermoanaerobaculia bacterium]
MKRYLPSALESSEVEWLFKDDWPGNDVSMDRYLQLFQVLDELGQEQGCRGTYWRTLERAAATLGFEEFQGLFRRRFGDALKGLEGHD